MKWIPISERLPELGKKILMAYISHSGIEMITIGFYSKKYLWESEYHYPIKNVTHWMSLPSKPNKPVFNKSLLENAIEKASVNLSKIKNVDDWVQELN